MYAWHTVRHAVCWVATRGTLSALQHTFCGLWLFQLYAACSTVLLHLALPNQPACFLAAAAEAMF